MFDAKAAALTNTGALAFSAAVASVVPNLGVLILCAGIGASAGSILPIFRPRLAESIRLYLGTIIAATIAAAIIGYFVLGFAPIGGAFLAALVAALFAPNFFIDPVEAATDTKKFLDNIVQGVKQVKK